MLDFFQKKRGTFKNDILSGITVALALVPEAVAFSFVAGVEPQVGLFSAFMVGLIAATFGGRPGMISGATGAVAVVIAPLVASYGVEYLFATIILAGILQIIAGLLRWGKFIRLVPHPVMLGFVNGLAIIIFLSQFEAFKTETASGSSVWISGVPLLVILGLIALTMAVIQFLPKLTKAIPSALAAIVVCTLAAMGLEHFGLHTPTVAEMAGGSLAGGFPPLHLPNIPLDFETLKILFSFAAPVAAVGLIESLMTLTLIDEITGTRGRGNRECIGQGSANILSGLFGGMGGCAMIGQSMINISSGGRGRTSGITAAVGLLLFVLFGANLIGQIPTAALVGVMLMVVIGTFEWTTFRILHKIPKTDTLIILAVSIITVFTNLAVAVAIGIIISALVFAWEKGKKIDCTTYSDEHGTKVYKLNGPLFFGSAHNFAALFEPAGDPDEVVIDFLHSRVYDHSALDALHKLTARYAEAGKHLHLLNLSKECLTLLGNAEGVVEASVIEDLDWHLAVDELD
ncbi:MAG: SulP family inorganic anion transporter [Kiritimatiellales bacterium]|nr:SulP family inorganic anion transporter [Kiritimatiellales bacterium]